MPHFVTSFFWPKYSMAYLHPTDMCFKKTPRQNGLGLKMGGKMMRTYALCGSRNIEINVNLKIWAQGGLPTTLGHKISGVVHNFVKSKKHIA